MNIEYLHNNTCSRFKDGMYMTYVSRKGNQAFCDAQCTTNAIQLFDLLMYLITKSFEFNSV